MADFDPILGNLRQLTATDNMEPVPQQPPLAGPVQGAGEVTGDVLQNIGSLFTPSYPTPMAAPSGESEGPGLEPEEIVALQQQKQAQRQAGIASDEDWFEYTGGHDQRQQLGIIPDPVREIEVNRGPVFGGIYKDALKLAEQGDISEYKAFELAEETWENIGFDPSAQEQLLDYRERGKEPVKYAKTAKYILEKDQNELTPEEDSWVREQIPTKLLDRIFPAEEDTNTQNERRARRLSRKQILRAFALHVDPQKQWQETGLRLQEIFDSSNEKLHATIQDGALAEGYIQEISDPKMFRHSDTYRPDPQGVAAGPLDISPGSGYLDERTEARRGMLNAAKRLLLTHYGPDATSFFSDEDVVIEKLKDIQRAGVRANEELIGRQSLFFEMSSGGLERVIGDDHKGVSHKKTAILPNIMDLAMMWGKRTRPGFTGTTEEIKDLVKSPWFDNMQMLYEDLFRAGELGSTEGVVAGRNSIVRAIYNIYKYKGEGDIEDMKQLWMATEFVPTSKFTGTNFVLPDGSFRIPVSDEDWFQSVQESLEKTKEKATDPEFRQKMSGLGVYLADGFLENLKGDFVPGGMDTLPKDHPLLERFPEIKRHNEGRDFESEVAQFVRGIPVTGSMLDKMLLGKPWQMQMNTRESVVFTDSLMKMRAVLDANPETYLDIPFHGTLAPMFRRMDMIGQKYGPISQMIMRLEAADLARHDLDFSEKMRLASTHVGSFSWMAAKGLAKIGYETIENATRAATWMPVFAVGAVQESIADVTGSKTFDEAAQATKDYGASLAINFHEDMKFAGSSMVLMSEHYMNMLDDPQYRDDYWRFRPIEYVLDYASAVEAFLATPRVAVKAAASAPYIAGKVVKVYETGAKTGRRLSRVIREADASGVPRSAVLSDLPGSLSLTKDFDSVGPKFVVIRQELPETRLKAIKADNLQDWSTTQAKYIELGQWKHTDGGKKVRGEKKARGGKRKLRKEIKKEIEGRKQEHRKAVEDALDRGEVVPLEVLEDYPDLAVRAIDREAGTAYIRGSDKVGGQKAADPPPSTRPLSSRLQSSADRIEAIQGGFYAPFRKGGFKAIYQKSADWLQNQAAGGHPAARIVANMMFDKTERLGPKMEVVIDSSRERVNTTLYVSHTALMEGLSKSVLMQSDETIGSIATFIQNMVEEVGVNYSKEPAWFGDFGDIVTAKMENPKIALESFYGQIPGAAIVNQSDKIFGVRVDGRMLSFEDIATDLQSVLDEGTQEILKNKTLREALLEPQKLEAKGGKAFPWTSTEREKVQKALDGIKKSLSKNPRLARIFDNPKTFENFVAGVARESLTEMYSTLSKMYEKGAKVKVDDLIVRVPHGDETLNVKIKDFEKAFMSDESALKTSELLAGYSMDATSLDLPKWKVTGHKKRSLWDSEDTENYKKTGEHPLAEYEVSALDLGLVVEDGKLLKPSPIINKILFEKDTRTAISVEHLSPMQIMARMDMLRASLTMASENMYGVFALREGMFIPTKTKVPKADLSVTGKPIPEQALDSTLSRIDRASSAFDQPDVAKMLEKEMGMKPGAVFRSNESGAKWLADIVAGSGNRGKLVRFVGQKGKDKWYMPRQVRQKYTGPMFSAHSLGNGEIALKYVGGPKNGQFVSKTDITNAIVRHISDNQMPIKAAELLKKALKKESAEARKIKKADGKLPTKEEGALRFIENRREAFFDHIRNMLHDLGMPLEFVNTIKFNTNKKITAKILSDEGALSSFFDLDNISVKIAEDYSAFDVKDTFFGKHLFNSAEDGTALQALTAADNVLLGGKNSISSPSKGGIIKDISDAYEVNAQTMRDSLHKRFINIEKAKKNPASAVVAAYLSMDTHASMAMWQYLKTGEMPPIMTSELGKVLVRQWRRSGLWSGGVANGKLTSLGVSAGFVRAELGERFYRTAITRAVMEGSKVFSGPGGNFFNISKMFPQHLQGVAFALDDTVNDLMGKMSRDLSVHFNSGLYSGDIQKAGRMLTYFHDAYRDIFDKMVANLDPLSGDNMTAIKSVAKMKHVDEAERFLSESPHLQDNYFFAAQVTWAQVKHRIERLNIIHKGWEEGHILPGVPVYDESGNIVRYSNPGTEQDFIPLDMQAIGVVSDAKLDKLENLALGEIWGTAAVTAEGAPKMYVRRHFAETLRLGDKNFKNFKGTFEGGNPLFSNMSAITHSIATNLDRFGDLGTKFNAMNSVQWWKTQKLMRAGIAPIVRNLFTNIVLLSRERPDLLVPGGGFWEDMADYAMTVRSGIYEADTATMTDFNRWFKGTGIGGNTQTSDFIKTGRLPVPGEIDRYWSGVLAKSDYEHAHKKVQVVGEAPEATYKSLEKAGVDVSGEAKKRTSQLESQLKELRTIEASSDLANGWLDIVMKRYGKDYAWLAMNTPARSSLTLLHDSFNYVFGFTPTTPVEWVTGIPRARGYDVFTRATADMFSLVDEAPKYALAKRLWMEKGPGKAVADGQFRLGKYGDGGWDAWKNAPEPWRNAEFEAYKKAGYLTPSDIRQVVGDLLTDYTKSSPMLQGARGFVNPFMYFTAKVTSGISKFFMKNPLLARASQSLYSYLYALQFDTPEELTALRGVSPDNASMLLSTPVGLFDVSYLNLVMDPGQLVNPSEWQTFQAMEDFVKIIFGAFPKSRATTTMEEDGVVAAILAAERLGDFTHGSAQVNWMKLLALRYASTKMPAHSEGFWRSIAKEMKESAAPNLRYLIDSITGDPYRRKESLTTQVVTPTDAILRLIFGLRTLKQEPMYDAAQAARAFSERRGAERTIKLQGKRSKVQQITDIIAQTDQTIPEFYRESRAREVLRALDDSRFWAVPEHKAQKLAASGFFSLMSIIPKQLLADRRNKDWIMEQDPAVIEALIRRVLSNKGAAPAEIENYIRGIRDPSYNVGAQVPVEQPQFPVPGVVSPGVGTGVRVPGRAAQFPVEQPQGIDMMRNINELGRGRF